MCCPYVNWQSAKTICFSDKNLWPYQKQDINVDFSGKSRMKIIASERHWRLPSSPIVGRICMCSRRNRREDDDEDDEDDDDDDGDDDDDDDDDR